MKRTALTLTLASLAAAPLAAHPSHAPNSVAEEPRMVVVVLAHPDDELVFAPALHGLARGGVDVTIIYATEGDQGPGVSEMEPGSELGRVRTLEASCATNALDARTMVSLNLGDGTLGVQARKANSSANLLQEKLKDWIGEATTVITWGPEGGYGHSDHRIVSAVVTQLVQAMPAEERPSLLYPALINAPLPDLLTAQGWTLTAPDLAKVNYKYNEADLAAANAAVQCHKTQFDDATRAMFVPGFDQGVWKGAVSFRPAF